MGLGRAIAGYVNPLPALLVLFLMLGAWSWATYIDGWFIALYPCPKCAIYHSQR